MQTEPTYARLTRFEVAALLFVVVLAKVWAIGASHIYDDAFITYRYALNLAQGHGMVFNPGAAWEPVLGTTTPGYTAVLAGAIRAGFDPVNASLVLNGLFDLCSAVLLLSLLGWRRWSGALAVLAFSSMPEFVRISAGGMEAPLFLLAALLAIWLQRRERFIGCGVAAALACTLRPEAVLLVLIVLMDSRRSLAALVRILLPVGLIGSAYTAVLVWYYGSPIPHSVMSKAKMHGGSPLLDTWREILEQSFLPAGTKLQIFYLLLLPFVCVGFWRGLRSRSGVRPLLLLSLMMTAAYLAARPHTWGWYYYVPLCAWVVALGLGLEPLVERAGHPLLRVHGERLARITVLALTLSVAAILWLVTRYREDHVASRVYAPIAAWAEEVDLAHGGQTVQASDIGAIGFYGGGGLVYDSEGLTWPEALLHPSAMDLVLTVLPDYLLLTAVQDRVRALRERADVARAYYPVRRFSARGETDLEPEIDDLTDHWVQDYLLYRRRL